MCFIFYFELVFDQIEMYRKHMLLDLSIVIND